MADEPTPEERAVAEVLRYAEWDHPAVDTAREILAALNLPERDRQQFQAGLRAANNAITWNTSCLGCAKQLDSLINERAAGYVEGEADGYARAVAVLRDDNRYHHWWTRLPEQDPAYGYWQGPARRHLADYLETIERWKEGEEPS